MYAHAIYILWHATNDVQCDHLYFRHDSRTPHSSFTFGSRVGRGKKLFSDKLEKPSTSQVINKVQLSNYLQEGQYRWGLLIMILIHHRHHYHHHHHHHHHHHQKITTRWIVGSVSHAGVYPKEKKFIKPIVKALDAVSGDFWKNQFPKVYFQFSQ